MSLTDRLSGDEWAAFSPRPPGPSLGFPSIPQGLNQNHSGRTPAFFKLHSVGGLPQYDHMSNWSHASGSGCLRAERSGFNSPS